MATTLKDLSWILIRAALAMENSLLRQPLNHAKVRVLRRRTGRAFKEQPIIKTRAKSVLIYSKTIGKGKIWI